VLHLVTTRAHKRRATAILECQRCKGREIIETRIGVEVGKPRSGTRVLCCAQCHRNGERVALA
jgi:hypothetical protein